MLTVFSIFIWMSLNCIILIAFLIFILLAAKEYLSPHLHSSCSKGASFVLVLCSFSFSWHFICIPVCIKFPCFSNMICSLKSEIVCVLSDDILYRFHICIHHIYKSISDHVLTPYVVSNDSFDYFHSHKYDMWINKS